MRINTNVAALNSYNQLKNTNNNLSKSLSRLSSGKRINGAADDAAGLAISEKMGSQTRGLAQAQRNAQDGISMIQTAEGALKESHSILQRMRELSVQSANDTNTSEDRAEIQKEVNQLAKELTRIGETTEFNTQNLLDGTLDDTKFQIGANEGQNMEVAINDMRAEELGVAGDGNAEYKTAGTGGTNTNDITSTVNSVESDTALKAGTNLTEAKDLGGLVNVGGDGNNFASHALENEDGDIVAVSTDGGKNYHALGEAVSEENLEASSTSVLSDTAIATFSDPVVSGEVSFDASSTDDSTANLITSNVEATATVEIDGDLGTGTYEIVGGADVANAVDGNDYLIAKGAEKTAENVVAVTNDVSSSSDAWHAAEDQNDLSTATIDGEAIFTVNDNSLSVGDSINISSDGGIDVSSQEAADSAISTIDDAIANVSAERSKLGAVQNRLDHTINNLNTAEENLTAAESRISDVDMAKEMMNMSKQQILSQAGTAMMAQANQLPQGVLQLLG